MSPPQPNILVYDSSVLIRRMIKEALQSSHLEGEVLIIQTAATAVSKLSHHKIDILILQMDDEEEAKELLEAGVAAGVSHAVGLSGNSKKMAHLVGRFSPQGLGKVLHRFQEPPESENMVKELVAWVTGLLKSPLPPFGFSPSPQAGYSQALGEQPAYPHRHFNGGDKGPGGNPSPNPPPKSPSPRGGPYA